MCAEAVNPANAFSVTVAFAPAAKEPVQFNVCVAAASILYKIFAVVNVVLPPLVKTTLGVTVFTQVVEELTGFKILAIPASNEYEVTDVQPFELANTFHGAVETTANIREHCCCVNIYIPASSV